MARILVVDDDEGVRSFLADALRMDGHEVREAADGQAALDLLARHAVHVVVTDLKMPRLDGRELLARLRAEHPEVEVIVLTAHGTVDVAVEAMKRGAFDFLQKPIASPAALRELVGRAVERHRLHAREEARAGGEELELTWGAPAMVATVDALRRVAPTEATVLLTGPSGAGKEVAARAVHRWSRRAAGPFVAVNCAALSDTLLESELFGHERGAFSGAVARKRGKLELAEGGTFFLDEVGELRPDLQARLLRVLQERRFERVGGTQLIDADVRWIAATNRDLARQVAEGSFREDLYYRLAVFPVRVPALAERREDVLPLARRLLASVAGELGRPGLALTPAAEAVVQARAWPGNVRELRNALERAAILSDGRWIDAEALVGPGPAVPGSAAVPEVAAQGAEAASLEEVERRAIRDALAASGGHRRKAAERLGIGERTLYEKLRRYGLG